MRELLVNKIQCPDGTVLESRHRHDFKEHKQEDDRSYFVDGGLEYQRIGHSDKEYKDLCVYTDDDHSLIREHFTWGRNYDENMNRTPKTEMILLKNITDSHLSALIDLTKEDYPAKIHKVFVDEKEFRKGELL